MILRRIVIETIVGVVVAALSLFALLVEAGIASASGFHDLEKARP
jgi:hypothetical protein